MDDIVSKEVLEMIARSMASYIKAYDMFVVPDNMDYERYLKGKAKLEKMIKHIMKGKKLERYLDPEQLALQADMLERGAAAVDDSYFMVDY